MDLTPYTYLFIRKDLSFPQQLVQLAHAAGKAGHMFGDHSHMVCFELDGEQKLLDAASRLEAAGIDYHIFHEPDIGEHTAMCTKPLCGKDRNMMRRYKMYQAPA